MVAFNVQFKQLRHIENNPTESEEEEDQNRLLIIIRSMLSLLFLIWMNCVVCAESWKISLRREAKSEANIFLLL